MLLHFKKLNCDKICFPKFIGYLKKDLLSTIKDSNDLFILTGFSVNNYIGLKGFSSTLSPLPEHLQMRVMEEHGIANMMKQPACNRATDAIYAITSPVNGWRSGQSAEIWNQRLNLILMVLDCHQKDIKPVNKLFEYLLLICLFIILILEILVTDRCI